MPTTVLQGRLLSITVGTILLVSLSACGEFSYKRGASARDLQQQKDSCQTADRSDAEIRQCMRNNGWIMVDMDETTTLPENASPANKAVIKGTYSKSKADPFAVEEDIANAEPAPPLPADPNEVVKVNSWWKAGAGPDALMQQGDDCRNRVDSSDQISGNFSRVTVGFIECMAEKGWKVWLQ